MNQFAVIVKSLRVDIVAVSIITHHNTATRHSFDLCSVHCLFFVIIPSEIVSKRVSSGAMSELLEYVYVASRFTEYTAFATALAPPFSVVTLIISPFEL